MPFDPEKIPKWLRRTPEQKAQDVALQERLKNAMGPGARPNPTERRLIQAQATWTAASAQFEHLSQLENPDPEQLRSTQAQMAEALAMQGNYGEAAELHPDPEHATRLRAIDNAVNRDDNDPSCDCPIEQKHSGKSNQTIALPNENVVEMIYSTKHRKMMPLVVCRHCGDMNVKPATEAQDTRLRQFHSEHQKAKQQGGKNTAT